MTSRAWYHRIMYDVWVNRASCAHTNLEHARRVIGLTADEARFFAARYEKALAKVRYHAQRMGR